MNGLPALANQLASRGRGEDSVLVHMTPSEVGGLQSLAMANGGSLSTNPETGLPEAGFLKNILPMVAGAALASTGVGAPMAALMVGGGYGLATGSLKKGLMAGLGAFGGAGIGAGLAASGATTAPVLTGTQAGLTSAGEMAASNLAPEALNAASYGDIVSTGMQSPYFQAAQSNIDPALLESMSAEQVVNAPVLSSAPGVRPPAPTGMNFFRQAGQGILNLGEKRGRDAFAAGASEAALGLNPKLVAGAAAAPLISGMLEEPKTGAPESKAYIRPFKYDAGRQDVAYRTGRPGESTAEQTYFNPTFTPVGVYKAGTEPAYGTYAGGGLTALAQGGKLPPRYLEGSGDGMSDSIKARIGGMQEARLADGEFVIPADVVSHLGNGSSNAGAKKLHAMMDRIRKARTGKRRQAPEVKTERYMPA